MKGNEDLSAEIDDEVLQELYSWIDGIPLSRPKRNITRDFSDGVLAAEVVKHFFPKLVDLHNYPASNATDQKETNWRLMNRKVFKKLNFEVADDVIRAICTCKPVVIEHVLMALRTKIDRILWERDHPPPKQDEKPEVDQEQKSPYVASFASPASPRGRNKGKTGLKGAPVKGATGAAGAAKKGPNTSKQESPTVPQHHGSQSKLQPTAQVYPATDTVSKVQFEEKQQECLAKDETIQILNAKVRRLEHLLHLKDIRIEDLQQRLDQLRPSNPSGPVGTGYGPTRR
ncbi:sperm flagellar protein 1 isoform X1 [Lingula anatina]|uniref:Sperm flagellar protein 1 isoform X1 n=1 Tax=Lingula anatina TaxID=7574 RepID=A0A1S3IY39_LINAN|nr:sperm flagellar protein 1 isoform X1 [Lingula anatina]|eukprot:XP_013403110.1 sperm flagellar protein 1 isoform X1 [Lingula anatina]